MGLRFVTAILTMALAAHSFAAIDSGASATAGNSDSAIARLRELKMRNLKSAQESQLRQEFFDRVIFQINTNYKQGSLHEFLAKTYTQMAERQVHSPMYDFLMQAAELMRNRQEKYESPIDLTFRFMEAGGILKPLTAEQFLAAQSYTNGERSEAVTGMNREELGEYLERNETPKADFVPVLKNVEIRE